MLRLTSRELSERVRREKEELLSATRPGALPGLRPVRGSLP